MSSLCITTTFLCRHRENVVPFGHANEWVSNERNCGIPSAQGRNQCYLLFICRSFSFSQCDRVAPLHCLPLAVRFTVFQNTLPSHTIALTTMPIQLLIYYGKDTPRRVLVKEEYVTISVPANCLAMCLSGRYMENTRMFKDIKKRTS